MDNKNTIKNYERNYVVGPEKKTQNKSTFIKIPKNTTQECN